MKIDGTLELCFRIFRCAKSRGQGQVGTRPAIDIRIDDERQDRVKKRCGGEFDLTPVEQLTVKRDNLLNRDALQGENFVFVVLGEAAVLVAERNQAGIALERSIPEPGQVVPDLQVQKILCRKLAGDLGEIRPRDIGAAFHQQFVVACERAHHRGPVG